MRLTFQATVLAICTTLLLLKAKGAEPSVEEIISHVTHPVMDRYGIPGMAVGIVTKGRTSIYYYGVASKTTQIPVTSETLFEIGSVSKTFTATLAAYAQVTGHLSLTDSASKYLPSLRGSSFDRVTLLNLGTHTPGGLPLQVPDDITDNEQLIRYFQTWKPVCAPGTCRTYSNPSIGLLGLIAAKSMNQEFLRLMEGQFFPELGMTGTYLNVPDSQTRNYAQGYTEADAPTRMSPGVLALEAYGIRTTARDLLRFLEANLGMLTIDGKLQQAITATHTGYYRIGVMTQDLIWEQYHYPVELRDLLAGNSAKMIYEPNPATKLDPPLQPQDQVLI